MEAPHNTNFHTWMGKKLFCFFQTAETGNRTPDSGVKGSTTLGPPPLDLCTLAVVANPTFATPAQYNIGLACRAIYRNMGRSLNAGLIQGQRRRRVSSLIQHWANVSCLLCRRPIMVVRFSCSAP